MAQQPYKPIWVNPNPAGGYRSAKEDLELAEILAPYGSEEKELTAQLKRAEALRDTDVPQGLNPTGKVFTRANPLEFVAAGFKRYQGEKGVGEGYKKMGAMTKKLAEQFKKKIAELEARDQAQQMQQQVGPPDPLDAGPPVSAMMPSPLTPGVSPMAEDTFDDIMADGGTMGGVAGFGTEGF